MKRVKLWDISIRLFHWGLVVAVSLALYSAFEDKFGLYAEMHYYAGVTVLGLVTWRIIWGGVGSDTARFRVFLKSPKHIVAYLKGERTYTGHNPLGAISVLLMIILLLTQSVLGLFASDGMLFSGPFSVYAGDVTFITNLHETLGYILIGFIAVHILAVLFYELIKRQRLILPMITGWGFIVHKLEAPRVKSWGLAAWCAVAVAALLYWYIPAL